MLRLSGSKLGNVACQFALQVGSLVLRDGVLGSEAVEHSNYLGVESECFFLGNELAQLTNGVAGCLGIVAVAQTAAFSLADTLFGGLVICHVNAKNVFNLLLFSSP